MTNDELIQKILLGVRENYKQNQLILKELEAIKRSIRTIDPTNDDPQQPTDGEKPWDKWKKGDPEKGDTVKL